MQFVFSFLEAWKHFSLAFGSVHVTLESRNFDFVAEFLNSFFHEDCSWPFLLLRELESMAYPFLSVGFRCEFFLFHVHPGGLQ